MATDAKLTELWPDRDPDDPSFASPRRRITTEQMVAQARSMGVEVTISKLPAKGEIALLPGLRRESDERHD